MPTYSKSRNSKRRNSKASNKLSQRKKKNCKRNNLKSHKKKKKMLGSGDGSDGSFTFMCLKDYVIGGPDLTDAERDKKLRKVTVTKSGDSYTYKRFTPGKIYDGIQINFEVSDIELTKIEKDMMQKVMTQWYSISTSENSVPSGNLAFCIEKENYNQVFLPAEDTDKRPPISAPDKFKTWLNTLLEKHDPKIKAEQEQREAEQQQREEAELKQREEEEGKMSVGQISEFNTKI